MRTQILLGLISVCSGGFVVPPFPGIRVFRASHPCPQQRTSDSNCGEVAAMVLSQMDHYPRKEVEIPIGQFRTLVVGDPLGFDLLGGKTRGLPALQDILEKCVRELGAFRLIDSRMGVPWQLARDP